MQKVGQRPRPITSYRTFVKAVACKRRALKIAVRHKTAAAANKQESRHNILVSIAIVLLLLY